MPSTLSIGIWLKELYEHIEFVDYCSWLGASKYH